MKLPPELRIDRAIHLVDDAANKRTIDGYKRMFRDGQTKIYGKAKHP
jgi:hypothetical protein